MNQKESNLFSQLEKQYSKRSSYGKLFSELLATKRFEETRFLSKMEGMGLSEKSLKDSAKYLVDQIIRILSFYGKASNADLRLILDGIELLYAFGAIKHAEKLIRKGKSQARKRELIGIEIEFLSHEGKILTLNQNKDERIRALEKNLEQQKEANEKHSEKIIYQELYLKSLYLIEASLPMGKEKEMPENLVFELQKSPLLSPNYQPQTQTSLVLKNTILQALYKITGQSVKFYQSLLETAQLIKENSFLLEHNPRILARGLFQAALHEIQQKNDSGFRSHIESLKTLLTHSTVLNPEIYFRIKICELSWIYQNAKWGQFDALFSELKDRLENLSFLPIHQVFNVYFLLSLICLKSRHFSSGVKLTGQSLQLLSRKISIRDEFYLRVLQILHLIEIEYKELALARMEALNQFLYRKKGSLKGWKKLRDFLFQIINTSSEDDTRLLFQNFLRQKKDNEDVISLLDPIDFLSYCLSRTNNDF